MCKDQPDPHLRERVRKHVSYTCPVQGEQGEEPVDQDGDAGGDPIPEGQNAGMFPAPRELSPRRTEGEGKLEENQQADQSGEGDGGDHGCKHMGCAGIPTRAGRGHLRRAELGCVANERSSR